MLSKLKLIVLTLMAVCGLFTFNATLATAASPLKQACQSAPDSDLCKSDKEASKKNDNPIAVLIGKIANILAFMAGIFAVVMFLIGGQRFILSGGDANKVTEARRLIIYSLVGIVVAVLAAVVANFIVKRLL